MMRRNHEPPPTSALAKPTVLSGPTVPSKALLALSRELGVLVGRRLASQENEKSPRADRDPLALGQQ